jgi:hypothetical protein
METTLTQLSEAQAEKIALMVKTLLLHPEQVASAAGNPQAVMQAAGLSEEDILDVADYMDTLANTLRMELVPWWS